MRERLGDNDELRDAFDEYNAESCSYFIQFSRDFSFPRPEGSQPSTTFSITPGRKHGQWTV